MEIGEKEIEFLPRFWHSYSKLADIAKVENKDIEDLVYSIWVEFLGFEDRNICRCWFFFEDALTSRLYDFLISEGILAIEPGLNLEFSLTEYGEFFKKAIDKAGKRKQSFYEKQREIGKRKTKKGKSL